MNTNELKNASLRIIHSRTYVMKTIDLLDTVRLFICIISVITV